MAQTQLEISKMTLTSKEIRSIIPQGEKKIFDKEFVTPPDNEVSEAVKQYMATRIKDDDCDNRAFRMMVGMFGRQWAFGYAAIPGHAICFYINDKKQMKYIEPLDGAEIDGKVDLLLTILA